MDFNPLMLLAGNLTSIIQGSGENGTRKRQKRAGGEEGRERRHGGGEEEKKEAKMLSLSVSQGYQTSFLRLIEPHWNL